MPPWLAFAYKWKKFFWNTLPPTPTSKTFSKTSYFSVSDDCYRDHPDDRSNQSGLVDHHASSEARPHASHCLHRHSAGQLVTTSSGSSDIHDCSNFVNHGRMATQHPHDSSRTAINSKQSKFSSSNCSQAYPYYSSHGLASGGSSSVLLTSDPDYSDSLLLGLAVDGDDGDGGGPTHCWLRGDVHGIKIISFLKY